MAVEKQIPAADLPKAKASNLPKKEIEKIAAQFANAVGYRPGEEIEPIVKQSLGGNIEWLDLDEWLDDRTDTIEVRAPRDFTIYLSRVGGLLRNRFTLAHELGHYVLHSFMGEIPLRAARSEMNERIEWEANWFAANFLMPEEEFKAALERHGDRVNPIAGHFLVSPTAVKVRKQSVV